MGQNVTIAGASYPDVPALDIPKTGGGTARFVDTADDTVTPATLKSGVTAHDASGAKITGTLDTTPPEESDINFWDYNGTLLYSWTLAELATKTELPPLPSHDGLICQGWNWTLEEIKATGYGADVGAIYITDDGKSRLYITLTELDDMTITVYFHQSAAGLVSVDFGDGSEAQTVATSGNVSISHTYSQTGNFIITMGRTADSGTYSPSGTSTNTIFAPYSTTNYRARVILTCAHLGSGVTTLRQNLFGGYRNLRAITIPEGVTGGSEQIFIDCSSLRCVALPRTMKTIPGYFVSGCHVENFSVGGAATALAYGSFSSVAIMKRLLLPSSVASISTTMITSNVCMGKFRFPRLIKNVPANSFVSCVNLRDVVIPQGCQSIGSRAFDTAKSLPRLIFPSTLSSIGAQAFNNCTSMRFYDFTACTAVPTLANANAFTNIPADCEIRVPAAIVDTWKAATNWSTYADHIVGV